MEIGERPWGTYTVLDERKGYKIKIIEVIPGERLSLQKHYHRSEHWVVVSGTAKVTCGDREHIVNINESTFIPIGSSHRLENPGLIPLVIIEVQSGEYLGEDDIVRFKDDYQRVEMNPMLATVTSECLDEPNPDSRLLQEQKTFESVF